MPGGTPGIFYRADDDRKLEGDGRWTPSIHMPRWASRITLEITEVRVERLREISVDDAIAEGLTRRAGALETWWGNGFDGDTPNADAAYFLSPIECYRALWDQINGAGAWDKNPWIWAITFRKLPAQPRTTDSL